MPKNAEHATESQKRHIAENLWLHYYNRTLLEKGLISEQEWSQMSVLINSRHPIKNPPVAKG